MFSVFPGEQALDYVRVSPAHMKLGFDIFRRFDDGESLWVAQATSIAEARITLAAVRRHSPGSYFVRDADTGQSIAAGEGENPEGSLDHA